MKIQKKKMGGGSGGRVREGGGSGWWGGGQGGCERRIKVFVKIQKKKMGGGAPGGRVCGGGCVRRIKVLLKIQNKTNFFFGGGVRWGSGWWGGWARVDVNVMFGVEGDVVYGGSEPRIEGIVQGT